MMLEFLEFFTRKRECGELSWKSGRVSTAFGVAACWGSRGDGSWGANQPINRGLKRLKRLKRRQSTLQRKYRR